MSASESTTIRRRQASLDDRLGRIPPPPGQGAASIVATLSSVPDGAGPRFFPVTLTVAGGPADPMPGDAGTFTTTTAPFQALSLLGGPTTLDDASMHVLMTLVDGVWVFEASP